MNPNTIPARNQPRTTNNGEWCFAKRGDARSLIVYLSFGIMPTPGERTVDRAKDGVLQCNLGN